MAAATMEHTLMDTNVQKARNLSAMACTKIRDTNVQKTRNPSAMARSRAQKTLARVLGVQRSV